MKSLFKLNKPFAGTFLFQGESIGKREVVSTNEQITEKVSTPEEIQKKQEKAAAVKAETVKHNEITKQEQAGANENLEKDLAVMDKSASEFLAMSPKELRGLFLNNGVVNFRGNTAAKQRIGAGDLFDASQKFVSIKYEGKSPIIAQRSIDSKFHNSKVGYVDENGNYLPITGGEKIGTLSEADGKEAFHPKVAIQEVSYTKKDGTVVAGAEAEGFYNNQFAEEVAMAEEYEKLDWTEKVQKSDEVALKTKVNLNTIPGGNERMANAIARIKTNKGKYLTIQARTGVPWMLVAAIHTRESGNNFSTYLHNGQPLGEVTTKVPKGIFFEKGQWTDAAVDALKSHNEFSIKPDAGLGEMALFAEKYNGLGYRNRGQASPYVYSGTDSYTAGKYVEDGKYDASTVDSQLGVMPIILALRASEIS